MKMEEKNQMIENYIREQAKKLNLEYKGILPDDKIEKGIDMFSDSSDEYEVIIQKIDLLIAKTKKQYLEFLKVLQENIQKGYQLENEPLNKVDLGSNLNGLYLSKQQIDLLSITELNSINDMAKFIEETCTQFPNKKLEDIIPNYQTMDLETCKKTIYQAYQDSMISYLESENLNGNYDRAKLKLEKLGITGAEKEMILDQYIMQGKINEAINYLRQTKGDDFVKQFNRYILDDYENVKSVSYEQMKELSELIQHDDSIDSVIIATGKFNNTVFSNGTNKYFDPYNMECALSYCKKHNLHMRYHALFDQTMMENLLKNGKNISNHDEILADVKSYINASLKFVQASNFDLPNGSKAINEIEIFNELIEKNKDNKNEPYEMVWLKNFGITLKDITNCFEEATRPDGVSYMYNETTLTESPYKRAAVEKIIAQIDEIKPGLIQSFGHQAHLSDEDFMSQNGLNNLQEACAMIERIQDGHYIIDGNKHIINNKLDVNSCNVKDGEQKNIECTENDLHFTEGFLKMLNVAEYSNHLPKNSERIIKSNMLNTFSQIYRANEIIPIRTTYWSIFNENDHNLCRANKKILNENKKISKNNEARKAIGKKEIPLQPFLKTMNAGLVKNDYSLKSAKFGQNNVSKLDSEDKASYDNIVETQHKGKSRMLVKKTPSSTSGFVSALAIILIIIFSGIMIAYSIVKQIN